MSLFRAYRRDVNQFETGTKGRLFVVDVSVNWPSNRKWQTKVLDSWKATQLTFLCQACVKVFCLLCGALFHVPHFVISLICIADKMAEECLFLVFCLTTINVLLVHLNVATSGIKSKSNSGYCFWSLLSVVRKML